MGSALRVAIFDANGDLRSVSDHARLCSYMYAHVHGSGTHWKPIGDAMGIQYDDLAHGPSDFKDGLEFFEDLREWADVYEKSYMVPVRYSACSA
jgi:hypothetical protein